MPSKNDPEIKRLYKDMRDGKVDLSLSWEGLMNERRELQRYSLDRNADRYWQRMRKDYTVSKNLTEKLYSSADVGWADCSKNANLHLNEWKCSIF